MKSNAAERDLVGASGAWYALVDQPMNGLPRAAGAEHIEGGAASPGGAMPSAARLGIEEERALHHALGHGFGRHCEKTMQSCAPEAAAFWIKPPPARVSSSGCGAK